MKYNIDLVSKIIYETEAESREEAIEKAIAAYPTHDADYIADDDGNSSCVDFCLSCAKPVFDENAAIDGDGNVFCNECLTELRPHRVE